MSTKSLPYGIIHFKESNLIGSEEDENEVSYDSSICLIIAILIPANLLLF
jgi:hypothetical protein